MPDIIFSEQQIDIETGDVLGVYSDGIGETMNEATDFFDDDRLHALVMQTRGMAAQETGAHRLAELARLAGEAE